MDEAAVFSFGPIAQLHPYAGISEGNVFFAGGAHIVETCMDRRRLGIGGSGFAGNFAWSGLIGSHCWSSRFAMRRLQIHPQPGALIHRLA
ncbi:hypothetical protein [Trinickia terrae]|uniref:hypothetical protein n=1 Tax=Trinickia terrae TaxID=2571161 RepID=UPI00197E2FEC|nr:hypothetical protein [Trinickia terrae]